VGKQQGISVEGSTLSLRGKRSQEKIKMEKRDLPNDVCRTMYQQGGKTFARPPGEEKKTLKSDKRGRE